MQKSDIKVRQAKLEKVKRCTNLEESKSKTNYREMQLFLISTIIICIFYQFTTTATQFQPVKITSNEINPDVPSASTLSCPNGVICSIAENNRIIESATVSPSIWNVKDPVRLSFKTLKHESNEDPKTVSVFLYHLENSNAMESDSNGAGRSSISEILNRNRNLNRDKSKKQGTTDKVKEEFSFTGLIIQQMFIKPNHIYNIEFTLPTWILKGRYLITVNAHDAGKDGEVSDAEASYRVDLGVLGEVRVDKNWIGERDIHTEEKQEEQEKQENRDKTIELASNDLPIPQEVVEKIATSLDSVISICEFCSSSKQFISICDQLFYRPDPQLFLKPTKTKTSQDKPPQPEPTFQVFPRSTKTICQFAKTEVLLQKLEFKYVSLQSAAPSMTSNSLRILTARARERSLPFVHATPTAVFWDPCFDIHNELMQNYRDRSLQLGARFSTFFSGMDVTFLFLNEYRKLHPSTIIYHNGVPYAADVLTLKQIHGWCEYLSEVPNSAEFKKKVSAKIASWNNGFNKFIRAVVAEIE
ncbi:hypothetical protein BKA69DRAFT_1129056 [Paraphysoderma sedebokerense]|nr:hypothetical protein BKA69DRAFT_1129056 [Paraphysoderma sedebokerense]